MMIAILLFSIAGASGEFAAGPAQYLFTKEELTDWNKSVLTDEQARAFIERFWARRDPTPGTPANEFRDSYETRLKVADERFHQPRLAGSLTDRGKVFMVLGAPTKLRRSHDAPASTIQTGATVPQQSSPKEVWVYEQGKLDIKLGQPVVELLFLDQYGTNDWKLDLQSKTDVYAMMESVARSYIVAAPVGPRGFRNAALRIAIDDLRTGKLQASPNLFVSVGEFITPAGEDFVPVQLYIPANADAGAPVTFFGSIEKGEETVAFFEEPATLTGTKGAAYVARSLSLPPGEYRGTFGVAREGEAPLIISTPVKVAGLDKDAPAVSQLILSTDVHPLKEAQAPTDPYTFGGLRVVPKSDATFRRSDELWYFFEVRNPSLDSKTQAPKLSVKLSVRGQTAKGASVNMVAPEEETPAQELKGMPGHWAVGQAMPLATFEAGTYKLGVTLKDVDVGWSYMLSADFRIVE
jgi:GWxTD domain-containing protein